MSREAFGVVDLDREAAPKAEAAPRRRPPRQCPHCYTNRSSILNRELKGYEDRALQALRRAHPEEYADYVRRERDAAHAATEQSWAKHLANKCRRSR